MCWGALAFTSVLASRVLQLREASSELERHVSESRRAVEEERRGFDEQRRTFERQRAELSSQVRTQRLEPQTIV